MKNKTGKLRNFIPDHGYLIMAFFLPAALLLLVYAFMGIYPFGGKTIMTTDMSQQYVDFFSAFRRVLLEGQNPFYSWSKVLGGNTIGLFAYYLSSPFSFVVFLFPKENITEGLMMLSLLKVALAGFTFALLMKYMYKRNSHIISLFAVCYALMAYSITFMLNIMWIDGLIFLPLIVMGIERILAENKFKLFYFSLTAMLIANYYIAYMICIFIVVYFIYRYIILNHSASFRAFWKKFGLFAGSAVLAGGTSAVLLLPTLILLISNKLSPDMTEPSVKFTTQALDPLSKLFVGSFDTLMNFSSPNIYCGIAVMILFVLYFASKDITVKEKLCTAGLAGFLYVSFCSEYLNTIWHGLQPPVWFNFRNAFIFSFFMLVISYKSFLNLKSVRLASLVRIFLALLGAVVIIQKFGYKNLTPEVIRTTVVFITIYSALFAVLIFKPGLSRLLQAMLALLIIFEIFINSIGIMQGINKELPYTQRSAYVSAEKKISSVVDEIKNLDSSFYRMEKTSMRSFNDAMGTDFYGVSHYSSSFEGANIMMLENLGFLKSHYCIAYQGSTILTDSIFNIKYVMSEVALNSGYPGVFEKFGVTTYENPYVLPLAFTVDKSILDYKADRTNLFVSQNDILNKMTGGWRNEYFSPVDFEETKLGVFGIRQYTFIAQNSYPVYIHSTVGENQDVNLIVNDIDYELPYNYGLTPICIGSFKPGTLVNIKMKPGDENMEFPVMQMYYFDTSAMAAASDYLNQEAMNITEFKGNYLKGSVTVGSADKLLFTSVPYDKGWTVKVDGRAVSTIKCMGALTAIDVPVGTHEIEFYYLPVGLIAGAAISIVSIMLFLTVAFLPLGKIFRRRAGKSQLN